MRGLLCPLQGKEGLRSCQYICIDVPKQVQLSDDAYQTLAALKERHESFSDVVHRLASSSRDLTALRRLGPRRTGWDDERFHREAAEADRRALSRQIGRPRSRRR